MIPRKFEYFAPTTVSEAVSLLRKYRDNAKILSGGMSLIPMMKLRVLSPQVIIDINNIKGLAYIKDGGKAVRIGALVRHADIEHSPIIREKFPMMADAAPHIADMQVRNLGTFLGALAHADPAADWPASALALDAELVAQGTAKRVIKATKFFKGPFETALKPTEMLVEAILPVPRGEKVGQAYLKFERKAGDYAIVGVASLLTLNRENVIQKAAIALTAVNPFPFRATDAEELLVGQKPSKDLIEQAAKAAAAMADPSSDLRGSAEYKREMAKVFTRRSLNRALERAGVAV